MCLRRCGNASSTPAQTIQFRRSARTGNKYAFVQLSDPSGSMELLAFSDLLENRQDGLKIGAKVVARCSAELSEGSLRYTLSSVDDVSKVLSRMKRICV